MKTTTPKFKAGDFVEWEHKSERKIGFIGEPTLIEDYDGIKRYYYNVGAGNKLKGYQIAETDLTMIS